MHVFCFQLIAQCITQHTYLIITMIPIAKFYETILKGVLISGVSCDREQNKRRRKVENKIFIGLKLGKKSKVGKQSKHDALDFLLFEVIRDRECSRLSKHEFGLDKIAFLSLFPGTFFGRYKSSLRFHSDSHKKLTEEE